MFAAVRPTLRSTRLDIAFGKSHLGFPKIPVAANLGVVARSFAIGRYPKSSVLSVFFNRNNYKIDKRYYSAEAEINGLTAREYAKISDDVMDALYDALDGFAEENANHDVEYSSGVLTFVSPNGTYVINKQPPNRQIWLSSPIAGPIQFAYDKGTGEWVDIRGSGATLAGLIKEEIGVEIEVEA